MSRPEPEAETARDVEAEFDRLIERFRGEPSDALRALMGILADAGAKHKQDPTNRAGARLATSTLAWFAKERNFLDAADLFSDLASCFEDLDNGTAEGLVKAPSFANRHPRKVIEKNVIANAVACVERLCSLEQSLTKSEARRIVAGWVNALPGFYGNGSDKKCQASNLKNWQQEFRRDPKLNQLLARHEKATLAATSLDALRSGLIKLKN